MAFFVAWGGVRSWFGRPRTCPQDLSPASTPPRILGSNSRFRDYRAPLCEGGRLRNGMHPPIRLARSARASARHATRPKGSDHAGSSALEAGAAVLAARRAPRMRCALWNGSRSSPRRRPSKRKLRSSPAADERRCPKPSTRLWLRLARAAEVWSAPPQERTAGMRRTSGTQPGARTRPDATGARSPAPPAILPASRTATARRSPPAGASRPQTSRSPSSRAGGAAPTSRGRRSRCP